MLHKILTCFRLGVRGLRQLYVIRILQIQIFFAAVPYIHYKFNQRTIESKVIQLKNKITLLGQHLTTNNALLLSVGRDINYTLNEHKLQLSKISPLPYFRNITLQMPVSFYYACLPVTFYLRYKLFYCMSCVANRVKNIGLCVRCNNLVERFLKVKILIKCFIR